MFTKKKEKELNDEISSLKHELTELRQIVKTQELMRLRAENTQLKEKDALASKVRFKLRSVAYCEETNSILVKYELPQISIRIDGDGNIVKNDFFYSVNKLRMISFDDMKKIQAVIDDVKRTQNENKR